MRLSRNASTVAWRSCDCVSAWLRSISAWREYSLWASIRPSVESFRLRMTKLLLGGDRSDRIPLQNRDVAEPGLGVVADAGHGAVDDLEPEAAAAGPDVAILDVERLSSHGPERLPLVPHEERSRLPRATRPENVEGVRRVVAAAVLGDVGAH